MNIYINEEGDITEVEAPHSMYSVSLALAMGGGWILSISCGDESLRILIPQAESVARFVSAEGQINIIQDGDGQ